MTFPYRLVATDLDGTLLRGDDTVSQRTRDALAAATAAGAAHIIVTGRAVPWTRHILDDLGYEGLAVCGQGAQVYHAGEHRLLTSLTLDRQLAGVALSKIEAEVGPLALAASRDGLDGEVLVGAGYRLQEGPLPVVAFEDPSELWSAPLNKVYIQHPVLDDDALAKVARATVGSLVDVVMAGPGIVEILPLGLTKATGLSLAARRLGLRAADTIAFGDMPNDIPMFGWAAHGVAMANAHEELKAVAHEITASNEQDGIAVVLEQLLQGRRAAVLRRMRGSNARGVFGPDHGLASRCLTTRPILREGAARADTRSKRPPPDSCLRAASRSGRWLLRCLPGAALLGARRTRAHTLGHRRAPLPVGGVDRTGVRRLNYCAPGGASVPLIFEAGQHTVLRPPLDHDACSCPSPRTTLRLKVYVPRAAATPRNSSARCSWPRAVVIPPQVELRRGRPAEVAWA